MKYTPKYNKQARQWDVVDENNEIVAMMQGGKKGLFQAEQYALYLMRDAEIQVLRSKVARQIGGEL